MKFKNWLIVGLFIFPASTNYKLDGFSLGNAGGGQVGTSSYSINAELGEIGGKMVGGSYDLGGGLGFVLQANAPKFVSFTNPDGTSYNKLHFVIDQQNNPSDAKYAIAISDDDFVTIEYVKSDLTVGTTLAWTDYQTYDEWGGESGSDIIGLETSKTYKIKAKAFQGRFTETGWGLGTSAATVVPTLVFDIDVAATNSESGSPYTIDLGDLFPGSVISSSQNIWVDVESNAVAGVAVYLYGVNSGLYSVAAGTTISSLTGDLTGVSQGYGVQGIGTSETSGSPLTIESPYDGTNEVVGAVDTLARRIFVTNGPTVGGRGWLGVKAKSSIETPASSDYGEVVTMIACGSF